MNCVQDKIITFLDELSDDALKKEATTEAKSDTFSSIMKSLRHLCRRVPAREDIESFRLKMILRWVRVRAYNLEVSLEFVSEVNWELPSAGLLFFNLFPLPRKKPYIPVSILHILFGVWCGQGLLLVKLLKENIPKPVSQPFFFPLLTYTYTVDIVKDDQ